MGKILEEEEILYLIALVQLELRNSGAADIANDRHYLMEDSDSSEARLLPPMKHLIELLEAFGRHMAVRDRQTYHLAINGINARLDGTNRVMGAVVVPAEGSTTREEVDLSKAPNLGALREALERLIGNLRETPSPGFSR